MSDSSSPLSAPRPVPAVVRIPVGIDGRQPDGFSSEITGSANGRYIFYTSAAGNLVAGDANGQQDVFRFDLQTGETILVSMFDVTAGAPDIQGDRPSYSVSVSQDGNIALFVSLARIDAHSNYPNVIVRNLQTGNNIVIQRQSEGSPTFGEAVLSSDGRYVFITTSEALTGDQNGAIDLFRIDLETGGAERISEFNRYNGWSDPTDTRLIHDVSNPVVSADGNFVLFTSSRGGILPDRNGDGFLDDGNYDGSNSIFPDYIYRKNLTTGDIHIVTRAAGDGLDGLANGTSSGGAISENGRYVAFTSRATNLVAGDANEWSDVFRKDMDTGEVVLVSSALDGTLGNGNSTAAAISANGRYVAFASLASNLVEGATDNNGRYDVFRKDLQTGEIIRISNSPDGAPGNGDSGLFDLGGASEAPRVFISADGRFVGFASSSSNLIRGDTNGLTDVFWVDTTVMANRTPYDLSLSTNRVAEDKRGGFEIGTLLGNDHDAGDTLTYSLVSDPDRKFQIVGDKLQLRTGATLDFEAKSFHDVTIRVTDQGGLTFDRTVTIQVDNVNEAPTKINLTDRWVDEAVAGATNPDTVVGVLSAEDPEQGTGGPFTYQLLDNAGGRFRLLTENGVTRVVVDRHDLIDYETAVAHRIVVQVQDAGGLTFEQDFTVNVRNILENRDPIQMTLTGSTVLENAADGTYVGNVLAVDLDGDAVNFEFANDQAGNPLDAEGRFALVGDGAGGWRIEVADGSRLDAETNASHTVTIRGTDSNGGTIVRTFVIGVNNINEAPDFEFVGTGQNNAWQVAENAAGGTRVGTLNFFRDQENQTVTYSLVDDAGGRFEIVNVNGEMQIVVKAGANIDFEALPVGGKSHTIRVQATDTGGLSTVKSYTIGVTDVPETPPQQRPTDIRLSNTSILENSEAGQSLGSLGTDLQNPDPNQRITFWLIDNGGGRFTLDATGTRIVVADGAKLDFETASSHQITVGLMDRDGLITTKSFTISVGNRNDAPTDITLTNAFVRENARVNDEVGALGAVDQDANESFTYELVNDAGGRFRLDTTGTKILVAGALDYETAMSHTITVRVRDGQNAPFTKDITINIGDVNESPGGGVVRPPASLALSGTNVAENAVAKTFIGDLSATDPDGNALAFSFDSTALAGGNANGNFAIEQGQDGVYRLVVADGASLDFETGKTHTITIKAVRVSDGTTVTSKSFTIGVSDVNEAPDITVIPQETGSAGSGALAIRENSAAGTVVGSLRAIDPERQAVFYDLLEDAGGRFEIRRVDGEDRIVVKGGVPLDFEALPADARFYTIKVRATDAAGANTTKTITIGIDDIVEDPPRLAQQTSSVAEMALDGTTVASIGGVGSFGDTFTFRLVDDAGGRFTLVGNELKVAQGLLLDFEQASSHQVKIEVRNQHGETSEEIFTISLSDVATENVTGSDAGDVIFSGSGVDQLVGGLGNDRLKAGAANDLVNGGLGNDTLYGGAGRDLLIGDRGMDVFVFDAALTRDNRDRVQGFSRREDKIWLDNDIFTRLAPGGSEANPLQLRKSAFAIGEARDRSDRIIYDKDTGWLSYDPDGSGGARAIKFAQLSKNLDLSHKHFFII